MSQKIKVAIVGVGNCASSLVQGCTYYSSTSDPDVGLINYKFGGYTIGDIEFVAAFEAALV
jgi:myo-inositol-1-phosphate synthase